MDTGGTGGAQKCPATEEHMEDTAQPTREPPSENFLYGSGDTVLGTGEELWG